MVYEPWWWCRGLGARTLHVGAYTRRLSGAPDSLIGEGHQGLHRRDTRPRARRNATTNGFYSWNQSREPQIRFECPVSCRVETQTCLFFVTGPRPRCSLVQRRNRAAWGQRRPPSMTQPPPGARGCKRWPT